MAGLLEDGNPFTARLRPRLQFSSHQSRCSLHFGTLEKIKSPSIISSNKYNRFLFCNLIGSGSANIRIGLATQDAPLNIPHCIARYTNQIPKFKVQDQVNSYLQLFYLLTAGLCFVVNFFSRL